jgi:hypothetical protein
VTSAPTGGGGLHTFVQWEVPFAPGPSDGRYLIRDIAGEDPHHVLVLGTVPAPVRRFFPGRRSRAAEASPAETGIARITLVDVTAVEADTAKAWLDTLTTEAVERELRWVNRALALHRAAAADPYVRELRTDDLLITRAGYGAGYEVADGQWDQARELRPDREERTRRERREMALRPQERLAALLSARDAVLACEELTLRARHDLVHGRTREAAMQAHLALESAISELQAFRDVRDIGARLGELEAQRDAVAAAANEAISGGLREPSLAAVTEGVERVEAALRARSASALY